MKYLLVLALVIAATVGCKGNKASTDKAASAGSATAVGSSGTDAPPNRPVTAADQAQQGVHDAAAELMRSFAPTGAATADTAGAAASLIKLIDAAARIKVQREAFDPAAIVAAVGRDRTALFHWVRDQTVLVPYQGSLRGPVGVLMDRHGNSLDRALLLAELLRLAGLEVRLANAQLADADVARLAAASAGRVPPAIPAMPSATADLVPVLAGLYGVDEAALAAKQAAVDAARSALAAQATARIKEQTASVAALVPAAAPSAAPDTAAFADHWWVQVDDGGAWSELDPSLPDAEPGLGLVVATSTPTVADIDDARRHTVTVRVVVETWRQGQRSEEVALEHNFAPQRFYGQRIVFTNTPLDFPELDKIVKEKDPAAAVRTAVAAQTEWIPTLTIGEFVKPGMSITDDGELFDLTAPDANTTRLARVVSRTTRVAVGGATDLLGSMPDTSDPNPGAVAAQPPVPKQLGFSAEWIEVEVNAPGAAPVKVRREVFDLIGSTARDAAKPVVLTAAGRLDRGLALAGEVELLPTFARIPDDFVVDRTIKALLGLRAIVPDLAKAVGKPLPDDLGDKLAKLPPFPGVLYSLASARFAWSAVADQTYLDRLNVLSRRNRYRVDAQGTFKRMTTLDIMTNRLGVRPGASDARGVRIAQGVADTVAESLVLVGCAAGNRACVRTDNASDELAATGAPGWTVATSAKPPDVSRLRFGGQQLVASDLEAGYAVVLPRAPHATWWRVDPVSGETLGMSAAGGSVSAEAVMLRLQLAGNLYTAIQCIPNIVGAYRRHAMEASAVTCVAGGALGGIGTVGTFVAPAAGSLMFYGVVGLAAVLLATDWGDWEDMFAGR